MLNSIFKFTLNEIGAALTGGEEGKEITYLNPKVLDSLGAKIAVNQDLRDPSQWMNRSDEIWFFDGVYKNQEHNLIDCQDTICLTKEQYNVDIIRDCVATLTLSSPFTSIRMPNNLIVREVTESFNFSALDRTADSIGYLARHVASFRLSENENMTQDLRDAIESNISRFAGNISKQLHEGQSTVTMNTPLVTATVQLTPRSDVTELDFINRPKVKAHEINQFFLKEEFRKVDAQLETSNHDLKELFKPTYRWMEPGAVCSDMQFLQVIYTAHAVSGTKHEELKEFILSNVWQIPSLKRKCDLFDFLDTAIGFCPDAIGFMLDCASDEFRCVLLNYYIKKHDIVAPKTSLMEMNAREVLSGHVKFT